MNEAFQAKAMYPEYGLDQMIDKVLRGRLPRVCGRDTHIETCFLDMQPFQGSSSTACGYKFAILMNISLEIKYCQNCEFDQAVEDRGQN